MPDIALDKASFVSLWVETTFYGLYSVLFFICIYVLLYSKRRSTSKINKPLMGTAVAMYSMSSLHIAINLFRGIQAFTESPEGAIAYFSEIWTWHSIFKQAIYATNNIVADGLVIYRCYVVWGFSYKIITAPCILLLSTTICAYAAVYNFSQVHPGQNVFASNIAEWGTALFSLSLGTNIIVTSLIAGRMWWISREAAKILGKRHGRKYNHAAAIILESGALYSVSLMTLLILYTRKTNAQYIAYDALAQIMGIVPTLIIVRVGLGVSTQDIYTYGNTTNTKVLSSLHAPSGTTAGVRMRIQRHVHRDDTVTEVEMEDLDEQDEGDLEINTKPEHAV